MRTVLLTTTALLIACSQGSDNSAAAPAPSPAAGDGNRATSPSAPPFAITEIARFDEPRAMTFIGNGPYALVAERNGTLILFNTRDGSKQKVSGVPPVYYGGQGGLGDIVMAPDPDPTDKLHPVYLSWVEAGSGDTRGAMVARADLIINTLDENAVALANLHIIWRQQKVGGSAHYSLRIAPSPDGRVVYISSGDRMKFDPAQDIAVNLGKIVRLNLDGTIPPDNPFARQGGVAAQIWSLGHRNVLGLAFDGQGRLWATEMGPEGGDEVNLIRRGGNYGWPRISNGSHYGGADIPDHATGDGFITPAAWWNPSISPADMAWYGAQLFPQWQNSLLVGALSGKALIRLKIEENALVKVDEWPMQRIREVEVAPDGAVWLLEDGRNARLLKLTPSR